MTKVWQVRLETVTPVHVGCGAVYSPMEYRMDSATSEMVVFGIHDLLHALDPKQRETFSRQAGQGTVESLVKIMKLVDQSGVEGRRIPVSGTILQKHQALLQTAGSKKEMPKEMRTGAIAKTVFRTTDLRPYLPGSSIKGAIRTAWLAKVQEKEKIPKDEKRDGISLEKELLHYRTIPEDPFRLLKVSDFHPVGEAKTKIGLVVRKKRNSKDLKDSNGQQALDLEWIPEGQVFTGQIRLDASGPGHGTGPGRAGAEEEVLKAVTAFFSECLRDETAILSGLGLSAVSVTNIPLRIGLHSGAESMTIPGHRKIKILMPGGGNQFRDKPTSVWLAGDGRKTATRPMGWCSFSVCNGPAWKGLMAEEESWSLAAGQKRAALWDERENAANRLLREKKMAEKKEREEEEKQQKLAAMDPLDQALFRLREEPDFPEQEITKLVHTELGAAQGEKERDLACALKEWHEKKGLWRVKKKAKSRYARVKKIQEVLEKHHL